MQTQLTLFIEFTKILNQILKESFGAELFCVKSPLKIFTKVFENNDGRVTLLTP